METGSIPKAKTRTEAAIQREERAKSMCARAAAKLTPDTITAAKDRPRLAFFIISNSFM
jgi:hypothetical protein